MKIIKSIFLFFVFFGVYSCCPSITMNDDPIKKIDKRDFPEKINFRTNIETFNRRYYFILRDGRIWFKEIKKKKAWQLLGSTGIPSGCHLKKFKAPDKVIAISADGVHLIALSDKNIFYRGTNIQNSPNDKFYWQDEWGWPAAYGPGLKMIKDLTSWSVSDSHPFNIKYYRDGNNKKHSVGMGVAHIYALGNNGKTLHFNDWWLPNDWSREICLPKRGKFDAINISASGSTIMIINRQGEIYTKIYDFDTAGENPLYTYSFIDKKPEKHVRKLPMPDWQKQPEIMNGTISSNITIFQTGKGNKERELRVEGIKDSKSGFFYKKIYDSSWKFKITNKATTKPLLNPSNNYEIPKTLRKDYIYKGKLTKKKVKGSLSIELLNFNMICSPAKMRLLYKDKAILVDGEELLLDFHHRHTLVKKKRSIAYWLKDKKAKIRGALVLDSKFHEKIKKIKNPKLKKKLLKYFKSLKVINFNGTVSMKKIKLKELSTWNLFRAPMNEKGNSSRFIFELEPIKLK